MSLFQEIKQLINEETNFLKEELESLNEKINDIQLKEGPKGDKGDSVKGDKGDSIKGDKGNSYILTETDKNDIAKKIKVPIVEKIIERVETIKEQPIITNTVKEVAVKLPSIDEIVEQVLLKIPRPRTGYGFSPRMRDLWINETPNGAINSSNVNFTVSTNVIPGSEIITVGGSVQELTEDYTFNGRTIVFVVAPVTGVRVRVKYQKL